MSLCSPVFCAVIEFADCLWRVEVKNLSSFNSTKCVFPVPKGPVSFILVMAGGEKIALPSTTGFSPIGAKK
eukprot:6478630-Amphidinium_carterae.1